MNHNQVCEKEEPGVSGLTVTATQAPFMQTFSDVSDAEGKYQIVGLEKGAPYHVEVMAPNAYPSNHEEIAPTNGCSFALKPLTLYLPLIVR